MVAVFRGLVAQQRIKLISIKVLSKVEFLTHGRGLQMLIKRVGGATACSVACLELR